MNNNRILYWDIAKAIAIFFVVWGHCLQNMTMDKDYWLVDRLSQFIISFHMPMFMIISGFFAYSSLTRPFGDVIKKKVQQLLLPSVSWFLIVSLMAMLLHSEFTTKRLYIILHSLLSSYWFLKSLFMCYLLTLVGIFLYKRKFWMLVIYITILLVVAESLNYVSTISMLPFFTIGILYRYYQSLLEKYIVITSLVCFGCYIVLFSIFDSVDYNIYLHPFSRTMGG